MAMCYNLKCKQMVDSIVNNIITINERYCDKCEFCNIQGCDLCGFSIMYELIKLNENSDRRTAQLERTIDKLQKDLKKLTKQNEDLKQRFGIAIGQNVLSNLNEGNMEIVSSRIISDFQNYTNNDILYIRKKIMESLTENNFQVQGLTHKIESLISSAIFRKGSDYIKQIKEKVSAQADYICKRYKMPSGENTEKIKASINELVFKGFISVKQAEEAEVEIIIKLYSLQVNALQFKQDIKVSIEEIKKTIQKLSIKAEVWTNIVKEIASLLQISIDQSSKISKKFEDPLLEISEKGIQLLLRIESSNPRGEIFFAEVDENYDESKHELQDYDYIHSNRTVIEFMKSPGLLINNEVIVKAKVYVKGKN